MHSRDFLSILKRDLMTDWSVIIANVKESVNKRSLVNQFYQQHLTFLSKIRRPLKFLI